ncbi:MAG: hypothetical protein PCFJNLEI_03626 [Verrucomicrobiae bacterium]|nr:hypothetical protein [Verrucomicrobiae bacterium]
MIHILVRFGVPPVTVIKKRTRPRTHSVKRRFTDIPDAKMVDIALESVFRSLSRFHIVFKRILRLPPKQLQRSLSLPTGH